MEKNTNQYRITEDGEANFYGIANKKNWLARVHFNGELSVETQNNLIKLMTQAINSMPSYERLKLNYPHLNWREAENEIDIDSLRAAAEEYDRQILKQKTTRQ